MSRRKPWRAGLIGANAFLDDLNETAGRYYSNALIDTPNAQVSITRPGLYRIDVSEDRLHTLVAVREGEMNVQTLGSVQQVLPGKMAYNLASIRHFGLGQELLTMLRTVKAVL